MRPSAPRRAAITVLSAALLVTLAGPATPPASAQVRSPESRMMHLINRARDNRDLRTLDRDRGLSRTARRHSRAMAHAGSIYHHACLACLLGGRPWHIGGENVGRGRSVNRVFEAFMGSSGHRANILRPGYRKVGVGVVKTGGWTWVTLIFWG